MVCFRSLYSCRVLQSESDLLGATFSTKKRRQGTVVKSRMAWIGFCLHFIHLDVVRSVLIDLIVLPDSSTAFNQSGQAVEMSASCHMDTTAVYLTPSHVFPVCVGPCCFTYLSLQRLVWKAIGVWCCCVFWELRERCKPQNVTCGLGGVAKVRASVRYQGEYA